MKKLLKDSQQSSVSWLNPEDFEYLCFDFAQKQMSFDEPIPDYSTRDNALKSGSQSNHLIYISLPNMLQVQILRKERLF